MIKYATCTTSVNALMFWIHARVHELSHGTIGWVHRYPEQMLFEIYNFQWMKQFAGSFLFNHFQIRIYCLDCFVDASSCFAMLWFLQVAAMSMNYLGESCLVTISCALLRGFNFPEKKSKLCGFNLCLYLVNWLRWQSCHIFRVTYFLFLYFICFSI